MENQTNEVKPNITIDDIAKLDIRVGKVKKAFLIEGTELIQQEVDFGPAVGTRVILSKVAKFTTPENMEGKNFPYIINLPPRKMRGVNSEGMIIAISDINGSTIMLNNEATEGSIVF